MQIPRTPFFSLIDFCTIFVGVWTILSVWAGYAGMNTPVLGIISLALALVLTHKWYSHDAREKAPLAIPILVFALILGGAAFTLFFMQHGFDLSADATPSIASQLITTHIPTTYLPYFDIPFFYQIGLPSLASQFHWTGVPDYVWLWAFALLGIGLTLFYVVRWSVHLSGKPEVGMWVAVLFLGLRLPFLNLLVGEYPWLLASGIGLGAAWLARDNWKIATLAFAAAGMIHPYIAFASFIFWFIATSFKLPISKEVVKPIPFILAIDLPVIYFQIIPFLGNGSVSFGGIDFRAIIPMIFGSASLFGLILVPFSIILVWKFIYFFAHRKFGEIWNAEKIIYVSVILFAAGVISYFALLFLPSSLAATKMFQLASYGALLFGGACLAKHIPQKWVRESMIGVVLLSVLVMGMSGDLQRLAHGSKATPEEAAFSTFLNHYDPELVPVLFLSPGGGKMAQYAHKIPSDPLAANFTLSLHVLRTPQAEALRAESAEFQTLLASRDPNEVNGFLVNHPAKYIVVNTRVFPALDGHTVLAHDGDFILYAGNA